MLSPAELQFIRDNCHLLSDRLIAERVLKEQLGDPQELLKASQPQQPMGFPPFGGFGQRGGPAPASPSNTERRPAYIDRHLEEMSLHGV